MHWLVESIQFLEVQKMNAFAINESLFWLQIEWKLLI